jgi:hypothetical protein
MRRTIDQYEPSPQEISQMCAKLQLRWSAAERRRRRSFQWGTRNRGLQQSRIWEPPVVVLTPSLAKALAE